MSRARRLLADQLGIGPGPELAALEAAILRQDGALAVPEASLVRAGLLLALAQGGRSSVVICVCGDHLAGLVDLLVRDTEDEPAALALLSHALVETRRRREGNVLTVEGYRPGVA